jgi:hypothetical protein
MGGNFLAGAELANHHALMSRLRMTGAILPIPHDFAAGTEKKNNRKSYPIITFRLKSYSTDVHYIWYNNDISCLLHLRTVPIGTVPIGTVPIPTELGSELRFNVLLNEKKAEILTNSLLRC